MKWLEDEAFGAAVFALQVQRQTLERLEAARGIESYDEAGELPAQLTSVVVAPP